MARLNEKEVESLAYDLSVRIEEKRILDWYYTGQVIECDCDDLFSKLCGGGPNTDDDQRCQCECHEPNMLTQEDLEDLIFPLVDYVEEDGQGKTIVHKQKPVRKSRDKKRQVLSKPD